MLLGFWTSFRWWDHFTTPPELLEFVWFYLQVVYRWEWKMAELFRANHFCDSSRHPISFFFINSSIRSLSLIRPASLFMPPWSMFHHVVPISCCWKKLQCVPLVSIESFSQHLVAGSHLSRKNFHTFHPCSHFYQRNVTGTLLIDPYIDGIFDEKHLQTHRFSHGFSHGFPHHGPRRCTWTAGNRCWITGWRPLLAGGDGWFRYETGNE